MGGGSKTPKWCYFINEWPLNTQYLLISASAVEGALQTRPGTDYYERNCDPAFSPKTTLSGSTVKGFTVTSAALEGSTGFTDTIKQYAAQGNYEHCYPLKIKNILGIIHK